MSMLERIVVGHGWPLALADPTCPYSIQILFTTSSSAVYVIRENDEYGEFPNIFVKVYFKQPTRSPLAVVLSDTGTGLNIRKKEVPTRRQDYLSDQQIMPSSDTIWNIATFLASTLNPGHAAPYIILTTHCHYDHICGIQHLLDAKVKMTVLASSYDKDYVTPWRNLQKHSLCAILGLKAPRYDARWIEDAQKVMIPGSSLAQDRLQTSITVIHTPGHTPDSISWYDSDSCTLCVGDMFYEKESDETRSGSGGRWAREPPQPTMFVPESNITDWNASMHRLLDYVRYLNRRMGTDDVQVRAPYKQNGEGSVVEFEESTTLEDGWSLIETAPSKRRVALCASHVTIGTDAEFALLDMLAFMFRVQLDQVPRTKVPDNHGYGDVWLWDDALATRSAAQQRASQVQNFQFSVQAPWSIVHRPRR